MSRGIPANMLPAWVHLREPSPPEKQRREWQRATRLQIAGQQIVEADRQRILGRLAAVDGELEQFTAEHVDSCQPKQARLREIQVLQIAEIADRAPKSAALEAERQSLQAEVDHANDALAEVVRRADDRRKSINDELQALPAGKPPIVLEGELIRYGRPDLLDQYMQNAIEQFWARQRLDFSTGYLASLRDVLEAAKRTGEPQDGHAEAVRKFAAEVEAASLKLNELSALEGALRHEIINE